MTRSTKTTRLVTQTAMFEDKVTPLAAPKESKIANKKSIKPTGSSPIDKKPLADKKSPPVDRMRERVRKLPPVHYTLYRSATKLLHYTYMLIEKFPKSEKLGLMQDIRSRTEEAVELVLEAVSFYSRGKNREALLRRADIKLKMIAVLVEYSYNKRYITDRNLTAWANKLAELDDEVVGWAMNLAKAPSTAKKGLSGVY